MIIKAKNLYFSYNNKIDILADVNFEVLENDFVGLIGPNGGGKTTLFKLVLGLLEPTRGEISVFGQKPNMNLDKIGYVPQYNKIDLNYPIDVWEVVLTGRLGFIKVGSRYRKEDKVQTEGILKELNLWDLRKKSIGDLSGGQRQRVLIARALVRKPKLLLLDEPTNSVDAQSGSDLYDLLHELNKKMTIMVVSHDIGSISKYVNKVFCLNKTINCSDMADVSVEGREKTKILYHKHECPII